MLSIPDACRGSEPQQARTDRSIPSQSLTAAIRRHALRLGFARLGICPAVRPTGFARLIQWIESGYAGQMHYLADRLPAYEHPRHVLDGVRSLVMLATPYRTQQAAGVEPGQGRLARYAWGTDYHDLIRRRLHELADQVRALAPHARLRGVVDTAPLLEREFSQLAGLGWIGKNTLLLNRELGSYFFLAALLTDLELDYDQPHGEEHCGACRACLDACPTGAFVAPYVLDSRRCISYLTIELRDAVPLELRQSVGDWLFGCDVCQEVCPWNQRAAQSLDQALWPREGTNPLELSRLFFLSEEEYRTRFRDTPLWRARRRGLLRNAALVLGNQRARGALDALSRGLSDGETLVRGASAWALGRLDVPAARQVLIQRRAIETDRTVIAEIDQAITAACAENGSADHRESESQASDSSAGSILVQ